MGEDDWGPVTSKGAVVSSVLLTLLLNSSCVTKPVTPYQSPQTPTAPTKKPNPSYEQLVADIRAASVAAPVQQEEPPKNVTLTAPPAMAYQNVTMNFDELRRHSLAETLSRHTAFDRSAASALVPANQRYQNLATGIFPESNCTMPSLLDTFEPEIAKTVTENPPPKTLKDYVDPSLKIVIDKKKAAAIETAQIKIKKAKGLNKKIQTFDKVEKIWGMPKIFFITTGFIESKWETESPNLFMYQPDSFADQLYRTGNDLIEQAREAGLKAQEPDSGKPLLDRRTFNDLNYAVQIAKNCKGSPDTPRHKKVVQDAQNNTLTATALTAEYLQQYLGEALGKLFPNDDVMAELARNGTAYAMHNVGAPGIMDMANNLDKPVNTKYIDAKKQKIFGIKVVTDKKRGLYADTNRSAIMKIIACYAGTEAGVQVALEQHNILPRTYASLLENHRPAVTLAANQFTANEI